jgi:gamma-glutamylcyclotransferase (GGCT)/AIG2-like uncharacterized protein YtfP
MAHLSDVEGRDTIPMFVYGTLMEGGSLEGWLADAAVDREPARVLGYRLMVPKQGWYPYMVPADRDVTYGELVWVKPGGHLTRLVDMEVSAGYTLSLVNVEADSCSISIPVLSFTWHHEVPANWTPVPNNDWMNAT